MTIGRKVNCEKKLYDKFPVNIFTKFAHGNNYYRQQEAKFVGLNQGTTRF